ncbi:M23 family metallopeptidase [Halarcobacter bivalviorum]|uniref:Peptidase M24 n=1 Tax=Halarcobacter bivalviorum TaxID=663364 RepID=A0AAX2A7G6_9BACT|nr:M23 family metallopeptidase [Halarcobacter bivalviorum]AXH13203.1 zinc metallopeptidase, M23 family [Halarcobacter bivalviorum]RXK10189.1 peptidase M24 [Halarcobacter bivalviorum]
MRRQKNSFGKLVIFLVLAIVIAAAVFVYFSPQFEKESPKITTENSLYWNGKDKLTISLYDDSGIKSYSAYYVSNNGPVVINNQKLSSKQTNVTFNLGDIRLDPNAKSVKIIIEVTDRSNWNFFQGNSVSKEFILEVDRKRPVANVITNSYNIRQGGSAAVVVEVKDENLSDKYITFNNEYRFELIPYKKENFYMAIIAWPVWEEEFSRVNLVAIDKANNKTISKVPLYIKDLKIKNDKIKISKDFVEKISIPVLQKSDYEVPTNSVDIFLKQNKELRLNNVATIKKASVENMSREQVEKFTLKPFLRLTGSKTFAGFAERRHYYYEGEKIDEAWHLGMDWASIKHANINISNPGKVIYNDYLGIYGNTLIIDHGYGVQSLYAHTSKSFVQTSEDVKAGDKIATTGSSGAVFGDHLHFGVLVQGIEVNPLEWMDRNWIKTRITNILQEADYAIKSSDK